MRVALTPSTPLKIALGGIGTAIALCIGGIESAGAPPAPGSFYRAAEVKPAGNPGDLSRVEPIADAPSGASAFRVLYISTGLDGKPITVSGIIVVPRGTVPDGGRNIVAWAHPTTGVNERCAPSLSKRFFDSLPGLQELLVRGYVVTATDYPGLGTPGPHPYLVGISEGRAVLDSVRAARRLARAAGSRFAIWGHSQGGQAALFAGELSRHYAPELSLVGIAVAAPATDLATLIHEDIGSTVGKILTSYILWSWSRIYVIPLDRIVTARALHAVDRIAGDCLETLPEDFFAALDAFPLRHKFLVSELGSVEPWRSFLARNRPGQAPAGAPLLITQGDADQIVRPAVTAKFVELLRRRGETAQFIELSKVDHLLAAKASATVAVKWIESRFSGIVAPNDNVRIMRR